MQHLQNTATVNMVQALLRVQQMTQTKQNKQTNKQTDTHTHMNAEVKIPRAEFPNCTCLTANSTEL